MPTEQPATADLGRLGLSVALDATPLLGNPTGVGVFCAGALGGLAARDDVSVSAFAISYRRRHGIVGKLPPGVTVRQRAMPARPLHLAWRRSQVPPVEWFVGRQDVVHGTNFVVPPSRRSARVVTVHDLTVVRFPELCDGPTLRYPDLIRRAVADGAWVHTPSAFVAAEVVEAFGVPPERVRAVHHGIPVLLPAAPFPEAALRSGMPLSEEPRPPTALPDAESMQDSHRFLPEGTNRYILAVGTVEPRKDYPSLVAAFDKVADAYPELALVVVGADGWGAEAFGAAVEASPVRSRIMRPGFVSDAQLAGLLEGAAVLAYPSVYEGFGFPPVQAMAAGVPVVATAVGAVPEVVGDGALLVAPRDPDALAAALDGLLRGGPEVEAQQERGRRRSEALTWSACAEGLLALYRDAVADQGRPGR